MSEKRTASPRTDRVPTPEESWQRTMDILELVNHIREARAKRLAGEATGTSAAATPRSVPRPSSDE